MFSILIRLCSCLSEDRSQCKDLAAIYAKINEADTILQKIFADNGIAKEDPMGQSFDPNRHEVGLHQCVCMGSLPGIRHCSSSPSLTRRLARWLMWFSQVIRSTIG